MTKLTKYEMETIINYNAGEQAAEMAKPVLPDGSEINIFPNHRP